MAGEVFIDSKSPSLEAQWLLNNERSVHAKGILDLQDGHLRELMNLKEKHMIEVVNLKVHSLDEKDRHTRELMDMLRQLNEKAVEKALASMTERQEDSNNKFALLKEQGLQAEARYATKTDILAMEEKSAIRFDSQGKQIATLARIAAIGTGVLLAMQILLQVYGTFK